MSILCKAIPALICLSAFHFGTVSVRAAVFGCSKDNGHYSCDKPAFTKTLSEAKTVTVESHPFNEISTNALQRLARELGKSIQPGPAELIFELEPTDVDGTVYYGPSDRELATLHVYIGGSNDKHEQLIWVESVVGQPDKPWAVVVHSAIQQFKANLKQCSRWAEPLGSDRCPSADFGSASDLSPSRRRLSRRPLRCGRSSLQPLRRLADVKLQAAVD